MSKNLIGVQAAHNRGQEDAAAGQYEPPHSMQDLFISGFNPFQDTAEMVKENEAYDLGYKNVK